MDDLEIRLRLSACRLEGQDADDPLMREALDALQARPALAAWFAQEQAFDRAISRHVRAAAAPAALRGEIIAAARASRAVPRWQQLRWLAVAACVALAALITTLWQPPSNPLPTLAEYRSDVAQAFSQMRTSGFSLNHKGAEISELGTWLVKHESPAAEAGDGMPQARPLGCRIIEWRGHKVSMICFTKGSGKAHLFIVDRRALGGLSDADALRAPQRLVGLPVAAWTDESRAYVLVGDTPATDLDSFL